MGKLISIVSNSRKQSERIAIEVQKLLKKKGNKVALAQIAGDTAPDYTKSPYISSLYDINARYAQEKVIRSKLKANDYVIVLGYSEETMVRELAKLNTLPEMKNYYNWLSNIEQNTYAIKPTDATYLVTDYPQDTLHILSKMKNNKYIIMPSKNSVNRIVKNIHSLKIPPKPVTSNTLFDVISLISSGIKVDYSYIDTQINDKGLQELIAANKLISKKLKATDSYIENITKPLGLPVYINNIPKILPQHTKGMLNLFDTLMDRYHTSTQAGNEIVSHPKNEVELSNLIAENYGMKNNENIKYTERMRIIENWAMQPNKTILQKYFTFEISTLLSFYDLLLLNQHFSPVITWEPISPINGYIDCTAPESVETIVQETFDNSTVLSSTASKKSEQYLLLGHKVVVKIVFNWNDVSRLFEKSSLGGSELLNRMINDVRMHFNEKFPIYVATISDKK